MEAKITHAELRGIYCLMRDAEKTRHYIDTVISAILNLVSEDAIKEGRPGDIIWGKIMGIDYPQKAEVSWIIYKNDKGSGIRITAEIIRLYGKMLPKNIALYDSHKGAISAKIDYLWVLYQTLPDFIDSFCDHFPCAMRYRIKELLEVKTNLNLIYGI